MIRNYLNQTLVHKTKSSVNDSNEATYSSASITARFEFDKKMVRNKYGEEQISLAKCFTKTAVAVDDVIVYSGIDWDVISVAVQVDLNGNVSHYEVRL